VEAVRLFRPDLILASYLRRAIPESVWREHICLVVHPGIVGDRGPSALDWAILNGEAEWGLTVLQAQTEMDAGPVWAAERFPMRAAKKSSLYRNEVTEAAVRAVTRALERYGEYRTGRWSPAVQDYDDPTVRGRFRPPMRQADRAIDWARDGTATVLRKINCADGFPGVRDSLFGRTCHVYDAQPFDAQGAPGSVLGRAGDGVVRATSNGAVWIGHVRRPDAEVPIKLPTIVAFPELVEVAEQKTLSSIRYEEEGSVGYLHFAFYNGAMGTKACERLREAYEQARRRPTRVIVLMGGPDFYGNGLDLNVIEAAASPAEESWRNINAMDDLCRAILETDSHLTISALQGNAGAGGAFLALAADFVWARSGVILNPHYKNMGNLYGSEYWTYSLPRRVGQDKAVQIMQRRLPMGTAGAVELGFIDACLDRDAAGFVVEVRRCACEMAGAPEYAAKLAEKRRRRAADEVEKPLSAYRAEELAHMRRNFYGFDPSYHVARYHFVHKTPASWTPRHLALHRRQETCPA
jgi:putative two-component system protein, hydrogenase maturation factor HypX/HoxX